MSSCLNDRYRESVHYLTFVLKLVQIQNCETYNILNVWVLFYHGDMLELSGVVEIFQSIIITYEAYKCISESCSTSRFVDTW